MWIGPLPAPAKWMRTWQQKNPDWKYELWDNERVSHETRPWELQDLIDRLTPTEEMLARWKEGFTRAVEGEITHAYHRLADIYRYEILFRYGGYMPGADSVALRSLDQVRPWKEDTELYTLNTGHLYTEARERLGRQPGGTMTDLYERYDPDNASPPLAARAGHPFLEACINDLKRSGIRIAPAVDMTGNVFMGKMLRKYGHFPGIEVKPYLKRADRHRNGMHSIHMAGTTKNCYRLGR